MKYQLEILLGGMLGGFALYMFGQASSIIHVLLIAIALTLVLIAIGRIGQGES